MPSYPAIPKARARSANERAGNRRSFASRISQRLSSRWAPAHDSWDDYDDYGNPDEGAPYYADAARWPGDDDPDDSGTRTRERTIARPLHGRTLAHAAIPPTAPAPASMPRETARQRALVPVALSTDSVPNLAAYHPAGYLTRTPALTRAVIQKASSPWAMTRTALVLVAMVLALIVSLTAAGDPGFAPPTIRAGASAGASASVATKVQPIIQLLRCDQYDSMQQCQDFGDAACSAATTTEVLTAWGVPKITIGRVIDEMGSDISMYGGLLTHAGFGLVAAKHGFRADLSSSLTYNQMLYITNTLGIPLIVDVRISYGYYRFLAGGHFLVMTGGDQNGVSIVDSSTYYIHYLPKDIFYSMFTGQTTLLVPANYQYTLPSN